MRNTCEPRQVEALSVASLAEYVVRMPRETVATIVATEHGTPWATINIAPMAGNARSVFPLYPNGVRGDTLKRGQSGVILIGDCATQNHAARLVIDRARKMAVNS